LFSSPTKADTFEFGRKGASAVMVAGLKPLTISQRPSDSSHRKIGMVAISDQTESNWWRPNSIVVVEARIRGLR